jgi:hypothetical protein
LIPDEDNITITVSGQEDALKGNQCIKEVNKSSRTRTPRKQKGIYNREFVSAQTMMYHPSSTGFEMNPGTQSPDPTNLSFDK